MSENRMSEFTARYRLLAVAVTFSLSTLLAGCGQYAGDAGAKRSQQQSKELQDRIRTTQVDR
jgi:hypothetical protein